MADPLDDAVNIGPNNEHVDKLVLDMMDPLAILIMCEEQDEQMGRESGTSLELYFFYNGLKGKS